MNGVYVYIDPRKASYEIDIRSVDSIIGLR